MTEHKAADAVRGYYAADKTLDTAALSNQDINALRLALAHIPGISGGSRSAYTTASDLVVLVAQIGDIYAREFDHASRIEFELADLRRDVDAARRIFGNTLTPKP